MLRLLVGFLGLCVLLTKCQGQQSLEKRNSTFYNPMLPGFHPDPSCIFLKEWDSTFFCASSSFNAFPGIPIHASKDLQNWRLIGHALNRREQLPGLAETNRSTSGIWAPALRYHKNTFYIVTTLVNDHLPQTDALRWDNIIFRGADPYKDESWSVATHFEFEGYDPSPFWDETGQAYITAAFAWQVNPGIYQTKANLETGQVGEWKRIWGGTGGTAPEGPHIYRKDGYYYLMTAEGGTGIDHMETISRSRNVDGPFEDNPANPVLTNRNTSSLFQTVGHADLFQDGDGNWQVLRRWGVALSTRGGPEYKYFPMVRETVLTPITWKKGEWPYFTQISGVMSGWSLPRVNKDITGDGPFIDEGDDVDFAPGTTFPLHFTHWRFPITNSFTVSPPGHPNTLRVKSSRLNLTAIKGNYAGPEGQSFVGRRQQDTFFTYSVNLEFVPKAEEEEAGITTFLTQNHQYHMGIVSLPQASDGTLVPHIRFRGESYVPVPAPVVTPVPEAWRGRPLTLEIKASNFTHYFFSIGPADAQHLMRTIVVAPSDPLSWGFTGTLLGVYCTTNGGLGNTEAYFSKWKYIPQGQPPNSSPTPSMGRTKPKKKGRSKTGAVPEAQVSPKTPSIDALLRKAQDLIVQCDYELAIKFVRRVLEQDPTNVEAKEMLGVSLLEEGELEEAKEVFQSLIPPHTGAPAVPPPSAYLYLAQLSGDDPRLALQHFNSAVNLLVSQLKGKELATNGTGSGDEAQMKNDIVRALVGQVEIWMDPRYDLCFEPEAEKTCEDLLNLALQTDPENSEALQTLASVRMSQQRPDDAKQVLERAWSVWKDLDLDDPMVPAIPMRLSLVKLLIELELYATALLVVHGIMSSDDQDVEAWYLEGWCFYLMSEKAQEDGGNYDGLTWQELAKDSRDCLETCRVLFRNQDHPDKPIWGHVEELIDKLESMGVQASPLEDPEDGSEDDWESASEDGDSDVEMQ